MPFKELKRDNVAPDQDGNKRVFKSGGKLSVLWRDIHAAEVLAETITPRDQVIDTVSIFEVTDEMGFESGFGAIVGKKKEE